MSDDLPEGWAVANLGEITAPSSEKVEPREQPNARYLSLEHIEGDTNRILGYGSGSDVNSTKAVFRAGSVLYGKLRPYLNKVCIPDFEGICSTDILVFPKRTGVDNRFLMRFLSQRHVVEYANHHSAGVQLPRISFEKLAELDFPLPPLAEQRRIVAAVEAVLARVDAARERLNRLPAMLKRFRQAVLATACAGRLTDDWRERQGISTELVEGPDGLEFPESWSCKPTADLVEPGTVISYGIVLPGPNRADGTPYIRGQDINDAGRIAVDELWKTSPEIAAKHKRSELRSGDVLLCVIRNLRVAVVPPGLDGANLTQGTVRLRPSSRVLGPYLARYLASPQAQGWMISRYVGTDMPRINVEHARSVPVAVPPLPEQREIVRRVDALFALADGVEAKLAAARRRVERIIQAALAKAFRGELVPTEAELARAEGRDYEPASALLERIRSEREANSVSPKRNGRRRKS
jgi:type I restriction enzyme S subunit